MPEPQTQSRWFLGSIDLHAVWMTLGLSLVAFVSAASVLPAKILLDASWTTYAALFLSINLFAASAPELYVVYKALEGRDRRAATPMQFVVANSAVLFMVSLVLTTIDALASWLVCRL